MVILQALPRTDVDEKDHSSLWYAYHIAHLLIAVLIYAIIGDLRNVSFFGVAMNDHFQNE